MPATARTDAHVILTSPGGTLSKGETLKGVHNMRLAILATTIAALAIPATAATSVYQTPQNGLNVVPLGPTEFEVIEDRGEGARGIWCAAASYVQSRLPGARQGMIYVQTPRGPSAVAPGQTGIGFTVNPQMLSVQPFQSYSVSVDRPGERLRVEHADQFCHDYLIEPGDVLFRLNGSSP